MFERLRRKRPPPLDWIQVEITTRCNASCIYCPNTVYKSSWPQLDMERRTFDNIAPAFKNTGLVFLQGWGEPFLHTDFFNMLSVAKSAGCTIGTTTNGTLLDDEKIRKIVEAKLDILAFSLAGVDDENDRIRHSTGIAQVFDTIERLHEEKRRLGSDRPLINIAYLLLKSRSKDLERLPTLFADKPVNQVVISTLDLVSSQELEGESFAWASTEEKRKIVNRLDGAVARGRRLGIDVHYQAGGAGPRLDNCTENARKAVVVSVKGDVTPCVFTNLPVEDAEIIIDGEKIPFKNISFGNVNREEISSILRNEEYRAFKKSLSSDKPPEFCKTCPKLFAAFA